MPRISDTDMRRYLKEVKNIKKIYSTDNAFATINDNGNIITWLSAKTMPQEKSAYLVSGCLLSSNV